jgi:hypothetical protein
MSDENNIDDLLNQYAPPEPEETGTVIPWKVGDRAWAIGITDGPDGKWDLIAKDSVAGITYEADANGSTTTLKLTESGQYLEATGNRVNKAAKQKLSIFRLAEDAYDECDKRNVALLKEREAQRKAEEERKRREAEERRKREAEEARQAAILRKKLADEVERRKREEQKRGYGWQRFGDGRNFPKAKGPYQVDANGNYRVVGHNDKGKEFVVEINNQGDQIIYDRCPNCGSYDCTGECDAGADACPYCGDRWCYGECPKAKAAKAKAKK